ncbi:hypothetical protein SLEP1_g42393 [Rubroshorea leprosula]|uniref:Uncharacterized protein n=1 Tax=Rubroshorea leprosula TaxID=152421 RepID=A0AAV5LA71_9ROSI|nr:hypothetical protein SLEP1_g42393 [Rubroshorea leprosula]
MYWRVLGLRMEEQKPKEQKPKEQKPKANENKPIVTE